MLGKNLTVKFQQGCQDQNDFTLYEHKSHRFFTDILA